MMTVPSQSWGCSVHLLLDSSGSELVCALADQEGIIVEERRRTGSADSRDIGAVAGSVLGELLVRDLQSVVVGRGPGRFIGTRVALSYANGLGATGEVPMRTKLRRVRIERDAVEFEFDVVVAEQP